MCPNRWIGYEVSSYAVAKTLVVKQMLEDGANDDSILQVEFVLWRDVAAGFDNQDFAGFCLPTLLLL